MLGKTWLLWFTAISILGLPTRVEAVNLSRYRVTVATTPSEPIARQDLDLSKVRGFCRDEDGCSVTLRFEVETAAGKLLQTKTAHLFLASNTLVWQTAEGSGRDGDGIEEELLSVHIDVASCSLIDATTGDVDDDQPGFQLSTGTPFDGECVLTLID